MLFHMERGVYKKAFGRLTFSNSKLDVYTRDGKLCSVNRDLLVFFSPFIKQLLKYVPEGIRASLILPDVSVDSLQHVFKVISNGFTDFANVQDLTDAGDILGINLHCLQCVENNPENVLARAESIKTPALDINNIKKEIIDEADLKKEVSDAVISDLVSEEIAVPLQAKKYDVGVECKKDQRVIDPLERDDKTHHSTLFVPSVCPAKKLKYQSPARIRRSIRRAMLRKAKNGENDGEQIAVDSRKKFELYQSPKKIFFRTSQDEQYSRNQSSQMFKWENTTYKSKIRGNRESTWQCRRPEYAEYHKPNPRDSWKSRSDETGEVTRKAAKMSKSTLITQREQNPSYILEDGEID